MDIPKGLYEVLVSKKLSTEQKCESVRHFAKGTLHLDGPHAGVLEPPAIALEDAELIVEALRNGFVVDASDPQSWSSMTCNGCQKVDASYHPDLADFDLLENPGEAIKFVKKHFQELGWSTSMGYDLCPDCVRKSEHDSRRV